MKQHLPPLKEQARRVVQEHRFWIPSLAHYQGIQQVNTKKLKEMMERKGQTGMVGFGSDGL